ncbi:MAG TPA: MarR family transcriptional regulator [Ktedonobacterales bacterium]|nr:MarR family transcriptional regulator [Ktedonobacterales bacterium]
MTTEQLAEELISLWRLLRGLSHPVRRGEITPEQYWLLRLLNRAGSLSIGELATELGITTSSATSACKRLEKAGLLTRERQSDDERKVRVALTTQGTAQLHAWHERKRDALTQLLSVLNQHEQEEFQQMLERVLDAAGAREFEQERDPDTHDSYHSSTGTC